MKYKIGDKVRIRKDLENGEEYGNYIVNYKMTNYRNKEVEIVNVLGDYYKIKEDNEVWYWTDEMFEGLAEYTYEDLRNSPIGTKITFRYKEVFMKTDNSMWKTKGNIYREDSDLKNFADNYGSLGEIIKIEEPTYTTVYETNADVLDEVEKKYLRNVIKPFRDRIRYIKKVGYEDEEYLIIAIDSDNSFGLPSFKKNTMYKGMELDKKYSVKELDL